MLASLHYCPLPFPSTLSHSAPPFPCASLALSCCARLLLLAMVSSSCSSYPSSRSLPSILLWRLSLAALACVSLLSLPSDVVAGRRRSTCRAGSVPPTWKAPARACACPKVAVVPPELIATLSSRTLRRQSCAVMTTLSAGTHGLEEKGVGVLHRTVDPHDLLPSC